MVSETISENNQRKETCLISDFEGDETEMTIEHIHKHCCVCGFLLPDNLTADQLRLLMLAAGETVTTMKAEYRYGTDGEPSEIQTTKAYELMTHDAQGLPPPLSPTDKVAILDTVEGARYWRVNDGPWKFDPDAPLTPDPFFRFPSWAYLTEKPVGGQHTTPVGTGTSTYTITALSISPSPARGSDRCWVLTVSGSGTQILPGQQDRVTENQHMLTACEPDFLVTTYTHHPVSGYGSDTKDSFYTYLYDTGDALAIPTQVVEVHCPPYDSWSQEKATCMYK
jgi:hypothetical protein